MPKSTSGRWFQIVAVVAVVAIVAAGVVVLVLVLQSTSRTVTAYFASGEGVFKDNSVRVLGIPVGKITKVEPQGTQVRIEMEITKSDLKLPADVRAVIVSPSVVTGRYVQFTPTYSGGPELADGAVVPIERTAVPLGVDDLARTTSELANALGPNGVNSHGALSDAIDVGAQNLRGNGAAMNQTIRNLGELSGTLSNSREELFGTVRELQSFTSTIAARDAQVREFNRRLEDVAGFLANDREDLGDAFRQLSIALGDVATFIRDNREILDSNVEHLVKVTDAVVRQKKALKEILDVAPAGLGNLTNAYNSIPGTLDTRTNLNVGTGSLATVICQSAAQAYGPSPPAPVPFNMTPIGIVCGGLPIGLSSPAAITALRTQLGFPADGPIPGLALPTDQPGAIPDVTTLPGGPVAAPGPARPAAPAAPAEPAPAEQAPPAPATPEPAVPEPPPGPALPIDPIVPGGGGR